MPLHKKGYAADCKNFRGISLIDIACMGTIATAKIFHRLMRRLNLVPFFAQGGDWGSIITTYMSEMFPDDILGLHVNMAALSQFAFPHVAVLQMIGSVWPGLLFTEHEASLMYPLMDNYKFLLEESGYFHLQATKPDTIGLILNDSPIGLAAYILEKFSTWTNPANVNETDGGLTKQYTLDELLTNVMIYWTTGTIGSSQRYYKEHLHQPHLMAFDRARVAVPTGIAIYPSELAKLPQRLLAYKYANITHFRYMLQGGHFAAFQKPNDFVDDVFLFANKLVFPS